MAPAAPTVIWGSRLLPLPSKEHGVSNWAPHPDPGLLHFGGHRTGWSQREAPNAQSRRKVGSPLVGFQALALRPLLPGTAAPARSRVFQQTWGRGRPWAVPTQEPS